VKSDTNGEGGPGAVVTPAAVGAVDADVGPECRVVAVVGVGIDVKGTGEVRGVLVADGAVPGTTFLGDDERRVVDTDLTVAGVLVVVTQGTVGGGGPARVVTKDERSTVPVATGVVAGGTVVTLARGDLHDANGFRQGGVVKPCPPAASVVAEETVGSVGVDLRERGVGVPVYLLVTSVHKEETETATGILMAVGTVGGGL
jgi:hypothetical protein